MIRVKINKDSKQIIIKGHAKFAKLGKDIVCASVSSIIITTINACQNIDKTSISYEESDGYIKLVVLNENEVILKLIENMLNLLTDLANTYKKNIIILKED